MASRGGSGNQHQRQDAMPAKAQKRMAQLQAAPSAPTWSTETPGSERFCLASPGSPRAPPPSRRRRPLVGAAPATWRAPGWPSISQVRSPSAEEMSWATSSPPIGHSAAAVPPRRWRWASMGTTCLGWPPRTTMAPWGRQQGGPRAKPTILAVGRCWLCARASANRHWSCPARPAASPESPHRCPHPKAPVDSRPEWPAATQSWQPSKCASRGDPRQGPQPMLWLLAALPPGDAGAAGAARPTSVGRAKAVRKRLGAGGARGSDGRPRHC
mmetsp:Transcript_88779/g.286917  ORF Transcript_88779/g.286917 Transcript_88779/m.286917 type:complete len:270 (+) Transcript_88779:505-1314(+)